MRKILLNIFLLLCLSASLYAESEHMEKISVQLKWKHQFQFAGFYMAKEKGFYKDVGLDVDLLEYSTGTDVVANVLTQKSQYGLGYPSIILDKTLSKDIILLSALLQSSPHVLLSLKSSHIDSISDFKNRTIMIEGSATNTASFLAMLSAKNMSMDDLKRIDPTYDVASLMNGEADLITAYASNETFALDQRGVKYNLWNPQDYGFDFYDDILFTSEKELKEHPQRVENFRNATLKGLKYAYSHIDETIEVIVDKYNSQHRTRDALKYEAQVLKKLAFYESGKLGSIEKVKVQRIIDIYNLLGLVKKKVNLDEFLYTPPSKFHLTPTEKEYLKEKKVITMCIDPNWMPFEKLEYGTHIGMSADYFKLIQQNLGVHFELVKTDTWDESLAFAKQRKCDILSLAMPTPAREKYLKFTDPYLQIPLVMATKTDTPFITNFSSLKGKTVGITKGYSFLELLQAKYPYLAIIEVENIQDGLTKVTEGKLYGYIGTLASIGYSFQKNFTGELKIAGKFDGTWDLGIGVRDDDPLMFNILQKAVQSIDENAKQHILNNWLAIKYEKNMDYTLIIELIGVFIIILLIVGIIAYRERRFKNTLELNHALLEAVINKIPSPMFYKDINGVYKNVNDAFSKGVLGLSQEELIGKKLFDFKGLVFEELHTLEEQDYKIYNDGSSQEYEVQLQIHDGTQKYFTLSKSVFTSEDNQLLGYVGIMSDITEFKNKEKKLEALASIDPLSKLYNRRYFSRTAEDILKIAQREKSKLSLLMIDIDHFKKINDTYGHKIGDDVIVLLSNILLTISRASDIVSRYGGEEFVILLPHTDRKGAFVIAEKIRMTVEELSLHPSESIELKFTVSIGVAEAYTYEEKSIEVGLKRADDALYEAKESGRNRVVKA